MGKPGAQAALRRLFHPQLCDNTNFWIPKATNPLPADAVTIPADARGAFHLPPACHPIGGSGASLLPRLWTADEVTVRPNRNRIGQLALCGQVAGDVLVVGCCAFEIRTQTGMRIEHKYALAIDIPCRLDCADLIRVTGNECNSIDFWLCRLKHDRDCEIHVRPLFLQFDDADKSLIGRCAGVVFFISSYLKIARAPTFRLKPCSA